METNYSPSVNIVRDEHRDIKYIVTPNAEKVANQINDLYRKGFHSFNIIGSYGTGKSSFLWALEKSIKGEKDYFKTNLQGTNQLEIINIVGEFDSFRNLLANHLKVPTKKRSVKETINALVSKISEDSLIFLVVDEFGKFLEYAVKNNVDEEIYFLQQLSEAINGPDSKCVFVTTLHQSFDAYGHYGLSDSERNEWRKVKGRFKDLTFNEPIEQLLLLAANNINSTPKQLPELSELIIDLQERFHIVNSEVGFMRGISHKLWPLDIISANLLCVALQRYGQNERSLFTFLESELQTITRHLDDRKQLGIPEIYDYVYHEFYSYLNSKFNVDYSGWSMINLALDRIDSDISQNRIVAEDIVKVVGFITLFGHKGAHVEKEFLCEYLDYLHGAKKVEKAIEQLVQIKVLRFNRFSRSFKITEGTDLNIEDALLKVSGEVENKLDIAHKLEEYFDFPVINAKSVSYRKGTPRFFQYSVSETPINVLPEEYQIDGLINLVFDPQINTWEIIETSKKVDEIIYVSFKNIKEIRESVYEIEKTQQVLKKNYEDKVARKELESIINSLKGLLNHQVIDALFTDDVQWYYKGKKLKISSKKGLNKKLSSICEEVYYLCPTFKNELINRHFISGNIANSKKILFDNLVSEYHQSNLGFSKDNFPAEKTIYLTLLKQTGIHRKDGHLYGLGRPSDKEFAKLWEYSESFIESAKNERKKVSSFYQLLSQKPFKLTSGFLEFWIPIFLFIRRDDFALFSKKEGYLPEITDAILYLFTRSASDYEIKSFDVQGIKLDLYNRYREFLQLKDVDRVNNKSLIESIKPFLVFYHDLNGYAQNTQRLSKETIMIRETIKRTQDPEKLFFEEFPKAMNMDLAEILESDKQLEGYVNKLRFSIKEIRSCYDELVNRLERFLNEEVLQTKGLSFESYKSLIMERYKSLKEHMLLPTQISLLIRLNSPLDDRNSWVNSVCHVILGKSLESIKDNEEELLKEKLKTSFHELDNLVSIADIHEQKVDQEVMRLQLTSFNNGLREETVMIPREVSEETQHQLEELTKLLGTNKKINLYLLMSLLKRQLDE